jgi:hypothetical protein
MNKTYAYVKMNFDKKVEQQNFDYIVRNYYHWIRIEKYFLMMLILH